MRIFAADARPVCEPGAAVVAEPWTAIEDRGSGFRRIGGEGGSNVVGADSGGLPVVRGSGDSGHDVLVVSLPAMALNQWPNGLLLQSVSLVLDGRASEPVARAVSFTRSSLALTLTLDADYTAIRATASATEAFTRSFQAVVMTAILGSGTDTDSAGSTADKDKKSALITNEEQLQQVVVTNISQGSTKVSFKVLDSADG